MVLPTVRRWLTIVVMSLLLATMSLPLMAAPDVVLAQGTSLSVNPTQGPPNTRVTATGNGFPANDTGIQIWFDQTDTGARANADSNGHFSVNFNVPSNATLGLHPVYATDGRNYASASFTVTSLTVTVDKVFTRDGSGNAKSAFVPGDAIQYAELVNNHSSSSVTATFNVRVTNPSGTVIFTSQWNMTLPSGVAGVYTPSTVPTNAIAGTYTFKVTVTYNGASSSGQSQFTVATVVMQKVWTADGSNNAKTSFHRGDAIRYMAQVKNYNSSTVTATFTFRATGPQQIYYWSGQGSVPTGTPGYYSPSTIPTSAPLGTYTLTVTVTYNGVSSSGQSKFTVS